ncbi:MAG TPA: single-stranded DNA-binding protein [Candidatus Fraserbacteria bacterium]|nr:single-stranded DNA-binding protein [Candidatus Fraserbacteria bacterium]
MAGLNRVILIGNLTRDPEMRYTQNGNARTTFSIAISTRYRDREGNLQETTTFVPIVVWGAQGENCANYLAKGRLVAIDGRLRIDSYQTEEGERRKIAEVVAGRVVFLGGRPTEAQAESPAPSGEPDEPQAAPSEPQEPAPAKPGEEEVPF